MSRGFGHVQRLVLEELDERLAAGDPWVDVQTIAERLEPAGPSSQARRSVRRALRLLAANGVVEIASRASTRTGKRESVLGRIAVARLDEAMIRRARRTQSRELRRDLGVGLLRWAREAPLAERRAEPVSAHRRDHSPNEEQTCRTDPLASCSLRALQRSQ